MKRTFFSSILILSAAVFVFQGPARAGQGSGTSLYGEIPEAMSPVECGRCHSHYATLKEAGGRHRFACQECHEVFHAYNPRKENFAELMPVCTDCHAPHPGIDQGCSVCHGNAHAPLRISFPRETGNACGACHGGPPRQMKEHPDAHGRQACEDCHGTAHRTVPACTGCHSAHVDGQGDDCFLCHPAHAPRNLFLPPDSAPSVCQSCHQGVFFRWVNGKRKHSEMPCAVCHGEHGLRPECGDCHRSPHAPEMTRNFQSCLGCHIDAHSL